MDNYVITIARSYGSGGRTLGKMLAKELGIDCYDLDLLKMASEESGINEALFGEADEKLTGHSFFKIVKGVYTGRVIEPGSDDFLSKENLFNYQAKVIKELAETTNCIIIGRCADYILKDYDNVIRLYFYAPVEDCIKRIKELYGDSGDKEILKKKNKIDKERAEYYNYYTGRDWNDASNYDMCLNTSSMSYEKCIEMVKAYMDICRK